MRASVSPSRSSPAARREAPQQLVAGEVAEGVVDAMEEVDVEIEQRVRAALALAAASALSRRSSSALRFGSAVSGRGW
jgi:hypothetical protein